MRDLPFWTNKKCCCRWCVLPVMYEGFDIASQTTSLAQPIKTRDKCQLSEADFAFLAMSAWKLSNKWLYEIKSNTHRARWEFDKNIIRLYFTGWTGRSIRWTLLHGIISFVVFTMHDLFNYLLIGSWTKYIQVVSTIQLLSIRAILPTPVNPTSFTFLLGGRTRSQTVVQDTKTLDLKRAFSINLS